MSMIGKVFDILEKCLSWFAVIFGFGGGMFALFMTLMYYNQNTLSSSINATYSFIITCLCFGLGIKGIFWLKGYKKEKQEEQRLESIRDDIEEITK